VKQSKAATKKREELSAEPVTSSSLFGEANPSLPPLQSSAMAEMEEPLEEFDLPTEEKELAIEEKEETVAEATPEEEAFHPQDITWEYLKGLEKISLLTPEKEVDLAKRIKEGERQSRRLETKTLRLKAELGVSRKPKNGAKRSAHAGRKNGKKKVSPSEGREKNLLYKKMLH